MLLVFSILLSASIVAVSSIWLFVVRGSKPDKCISFSSLRITAPHPPLPGFPEQAPSVYIVITPLIF